MSKASDVVIVGGGVIGLSIAYCLAREGILATVLDRRELGREASWAGAGLLPANTERLRLNPMVELRSWSAMLYPEWSESLREETGIDNGYARTGGVDVAWTESEEHDLRSTAGRWKTEGIVYERLLPHDFGRVEPALHPGLRVAYFLPDRAQVRNPRHLKALAAAASARGAILRPREAVTRFETRGDRVDAVRTPCGAISCGSVVLAAGAWTGGLVEHLGLLAPTPPLKGQIVLLRSDLPLLRRIIEHGRNYLVPRDDGRILVGSTEEDAGFDTRSTPEGVRSLLELALTLCPSLAMAEVESTWAGLRPGSLDTRPYIGALPGFSNAFIAAGHKRAGLQLSPATAEVVADLVIGRAPRIDLSWFRVAREPAMDDPESFRS
jgi:glycine oxidase